MEQIENWLADTNPNLENTALVITSEKNQGKKALLAHWIQKHINNKTKEYSDVVIPNFVTSLSSENSPNSIIYKIIIKIREIFNIRQRLELSEEKLRINFYYWLDLASRKIKNLKYFDGNLVILIEGVNFISDQDKNNESSLKFWLPKVLPDRVKLILTISKDSHNLEYLKKINCKFLDLNLDTQVQKQMIDLYTSNTFLSPKEYNQEILELIRKKQNQNPVQTNNVFYYKMLYKCFLPEVPKENMDISTEAINLVKSLFSKSTHVAELKEGLQTIDDVETLLNFIIEMYKSKFMKVEQFLLVFSALCFNYKGLTKNEIMTIVEIDAHSLDSILLVFQEFLIAYKSYIKITNPTFLQFFIKKYHTSFDSKIAIHKKISQAVENSPICLRQLEEMTNNLYLAHDFFQLKQKISSIENFLLLFNEVTKYDLFKFWKKLEEKGYDPIHEYNKSLELFDMHFNPKDDEIFMINIQISRFFKELSEFESPITPEFRHPLIKGKIIQTVDSIDYNFKKNEPVHEKKNDIKTFYELEPCFKSLKISKGDIFEQFRHYSLVFNAKNEEIDMTMITKNESSESQNEKLKNYLEEIGILQEFKSINILDSANNKILKEHESLNVEIPLNKVKFIEYFHNILNEKYSFKKKYHKKNQENYAFKIEDEDEEKKNPDEIMLINDQKEVVDNYTKMILEIDLSIEKTQPKMFYYYKRWIWMNYPWICLSKERIDFSFLIAFCYSDDKSFLNNDQEAVLYFKCLQIIYNCKEKKNSIFKQDEPEINLKEEHHKKQNTSVIKKDMGSIDIATGHKSILPSIRKNQSQKNMSIITQEKGDKGKNVNLLGSCMETMSKDQQSRIVSIITNNNHNVSITKLTSILQKSKFLENSIMKNNMLDMQNLIFNNENYNSAEIYKSKIDNLNLILDKWSQKEINLLRRKNEQIVSELNSVVFKKSCLMQQIAKLEEQKSFKQINEKSMVKEKQDETHHINAVYETRIQEMNEKLQVVMDQKKRYQQIIDICLINQISNEEWIRSLNFYLNNLKKVRLDQERQLQIKTTNLETKKAECKRIYENYIKNKEKRERFLKNFKKYIRQKEEIDRAIVLSDQKIVKEVKGRLIQETGQHKLENQKINESTIKASKLHQDQELEKRLAECMEEYQKIRFLVAKNYKPDGDNDENIDVLEDYDEDWHKNERFQKFMLNLQINKKLEVK